MTTIDALLALLTFAVVVLLAEVARLRRCIRIITDILQRQEDSLDHVKKTVKINREITETLGDSFKKLKDLVFQTISEREETE